MTIRAPIEIDRGDHKNRGERQAISLAVELSADLLLIDERKGRASAMRRGLKCAGTLGILDRAAQSQMVDLAKAVAALPLDFRETIRPSLIEQMIREDRQR